MKFEEVKRLLEVDNEGHTRLNGVIVFKKGEMPKRHKEEEDCLSWKIKSKEGDKIVKIVKNELLVVSRQHI